MGKQGVWSCHLRHAAGHMPGWKAAGRLPVRQRLWRSPALTAPHTLSGVLIDCTPFRFRPRHLSGIRAALTSGAVQCPSGTHARNGKGEPLDTVSPGLRLRYPQDGGAGPVPLQNVSRSFPVGQDGASMGEVWSAGMNLSEEKYRNRVRP
jgi:hypothetical protein